MSIARLREAGMGEVDIMMKLKTDLKGFDGHSVRRLHELSLGTPVVDDFASIVKTSKSLRHHEIQLDLTEAPQEVVLGSLVQYQGDPWCVLRVEKKTLFTLRRIQ
jgi:hypothetical protein